MKETWTVTFRSSKNESEVKEEDFLRLSRIDGALSNGNKIVFRDLLSTDYFVLQNTCDDLGISFPSLESGSTRGITVSKSVQYSRKELEEFPYLELARGESLAYAKSTGDGTLKRDKYFQSRVPLQIGPVGNGRFGIRGTAMRSFIEQNFEGLSFGPLEIEGGWINSTEEIFELKSTAVLPPMASEGCDDLGRVFPEGEYPRSDDGFYVLDGFVTDSRIAYHLATLPDFDVAFSREKFGPVLNQATPRLICSNRFYRMAVSVSSTLEWKVVLCK